jgi:hypothetical protein
MRERHWQNKYFGQEYGESERRDEKSDCGGDGRGVEEHIKLFS